MSLGVRRTLVSALPGVRLHRYPRSSPHATDGSRSVGAEGGAGATDNADYEVNVDGRLRTALAARISPFCAPGPTGVEVVIRLAGNHMIDPLRPLLRRAPA